ncbi:hypothetical protein A3J17_04870 [Candidatus Curtissbacteria bacterium RIFCSPLOWO2_02_FULL_40_11]|uniref:Four helix bundle protein n=2 Tax=Candidatus Curtissiibacteriota TaxID=1752717 RepID=A0A1F5GBJ9_9BACT|nr:MAG: hypothetical protein A3D04_00145 [Candidatus Curtissbacteria bacterium RIFCSPHIGHO2_02_FULL_40_16b]OGE00473.1 MAG: hypothetical protein A3J17_04870 [Candidatus Curtissbacteria bacterium RIFCSPLOWO2_02_FULL_40_11]OGE13980.1 MAG: hypothetical protein A3G14_03880 [Candidatus Curtissbacteria bacterium RIFCSPLOWO2_12_FULL_38_9]
MGDFTKLEIWIKAHELTLKVYALTSKLPKSELFVLTSQLRRAAISVESLIAEGESRYTMPDKLKFFIDSRASAAECECQLLIVKDVYENLSQEAVKLRAEYNALGKQINSLISYRRKNG